jgi:hypothetical protein
MKPVLKAPGTSRLKLKYDEMLSIFGFSFNWRPYIKVDPTYGAGLSKQRPSRHSPRFKNGRSTRQRV